MKELHLALIGGPQYDGLLGLLPAFEDQSGYHLHIDVRLPHVELNERMAKDLGTGEGRYDLISTHTKYCPSQAEHLQPLDELVHGEDLDDFVPRVLDLCRFSIGADPASEKLMQLPRNLDARLLFYRADLISPPATWDEALSQMVKHKGDDFYGFAFPGRQSGLFGTFYEMLGMAGGDLFDANLKPTFNSEAGEWALSFLHRLHSVDRVTPPDLIENWYYDEISERFREGDILMIGEWPGFYGLYQKPETCSVYDRFDVAVYPSGPAGIRKSYAGGHSFAIPKAARDPEGGVALAKYLTSSQVQWYEASVSGHTPVRQSIFEKIKSFHSGEGAAVERNARRMAALEETITHYAMIPPKFPQYPLIEDILAVGVQDAITGKCTAQEALVSMEKKVREVLK
jgi:multiple sugar transport system substrate-binding protein